MKILKKVLLILAALIGIILIIAAFLPSTMRVERSTVINKPVEEVFPQVADLNNFAKWNAFAKADTATKISVTGEPAKPGHAYAWESDVTGKGSMTLDTIIENKYVSSKMKFIEPMPGESNAYFKLEGSGNTTKVTWGFYGPADYPLGRLFGLFADAQLGKAFEDGLLNLKKRVEEGK